MPRLPDTMTFTRLRTRAIPTMQAEVQEFEDTATGARHIHLASDSPELVFLVALPTVPETSDGRAHILEHLSLCGSERYPVRDPFFAMMRRSTAHFMNAMTYADKTVYPFASTGKADFFNLLDVYLDAVFFPRLDYLDFLQEGWRLSPEGGRLTYQGIVFNEMKGAFADPVRALDNGIATCLLHGTTYAIESGGDPLDIPALTHAALREFHATHYHPSQAVFMTAGRIAPEEVQQQIETRVLSRLSGRKPFLLPQLAQAWSAPQSVTLDIPGREHGVQIAWLQGESADPAAYYESVLLESGLLGNSAAPLRHAMESAGFGRPSSMNGADGRGRQLVFHLGMEGLRKNQVDKARALIWSALEEAARTGVPPSVLQATLRDLRFRERDVASGSTPHGLRRLLRALPHAMYGGDIMNGFDKEALFAALHEKAGDPNYFKALAQALLNNPSRLDARVNPDAQYFERRKAIEEERLAALHAALTGPEMQRLRAESDALLERQRTAPDKSLLPRIRPQEVDALPPPTLPMAADDNGTIALSIASNGVCGVRVQYDVSGMDEDEWPWLQLYVDLAPDLGVGNRDYREADAWRHERVPHFDISLLSVQTQDGARALRLHVSFYAKGLREEMPAIAEVVSESVCMLRFDEHERLAFLIDREMQDLRDDLAESGDDYARIAAAAPLSPLRRFDDRTEGMAYLVFYQALHRRSQTEDGIREIAQRLADLHGRIVAGRPTVIAAGAGDDARRLASLIAAPGAGANADAAQPRQAGMPANLAVHAPAQVNHCFAVWAGPDIAHPDASALVVLGELLTNLVLHQALREEGGAYGGHASYNYASGLFAMSSYRDPRLAATYEAFERAIAWIAETELDQENIEEAIICVIQSLDKPRTPMEEISWSWTLARQGVTDDMRRRFRTGVLTCDAARLKEAAATWLQGKPYSRAAFVGDLKQDLAGLVPVELTPLVADAGE
jgi:presequence protease